MSKSKSSARPQLSRRKKIIFALIPTALLIALAIVGEIALRIVDVEFADDPYLNRALKVSIFREEERDGDRVYRISHPQAYGWRGVTFPIAKKPNTFRVFCLGGSACAGYPHPPEEDFGDYLEFALQSAFPDRRFEVLNVAAQGFASYRVRDVFDDVIEYDPDLIVLYSGNNEFLESRAYLGSARTVVQQSYLVRFLGVCFGKLFSPENSLSGWGMSRDVEITMILDKIERVALDLRTDPAQFAQVVEHYEYSIGHMLRAASERKVPLIALTVPVNTRDWRPNVSHNDLEGKARAEFDSLHLSGRGHQLRGNALAAAKDLSSALALAPGDAETHYRLAQSLEALGEAEEATRQFREAKDNDYNPNRALSLLNEKVRTLATATTGVELLDAEAEFARAARNAAPGWDLFVDYVHPNKSGNLLLAQKLFERILAANLVGTTPRTTEFRVPERDYDEELDVDMHRELLLLYTSMHQYESVVARADRALALLADGSGRLPPDGKTSREDYTKFFEAAKRVHTEYLAEHHKHLRGEPHEEGYEQRLRDSYSTFFFAYWYDQRDAMKQ